MTKLLRQPFAVRAARQPFAVRAARVSKEAVRMSQCELEFVYAIEGLEDDLMHSFCHILGTWTCAAL
jgi:hypothetical protein